MEFGSGAGLVKGANGRYRQMTTVRIPGKGLKKAVIHHTVHRQCTWADEPCGTIVSVYTKGRLCNKHRDMQDKRDAIAALEVWEVENALKAVANKEYKKRYNLTAWAKRQRLDNLS